MNIEIGKRYKVSIEKAIACESDRDFIELLKVNSPCYIELENHTGNSYYCYWAQPIINTTGRFKHYFITLTPARGCTDVLAHLEAHRRRIFRRNFAEFFCQF